MAAAKKTTGDDAVPDESQYAEEFTEEVWAYEPAGPSLLNKSLAEFAGTFVLVMIGVGTAMLGLFSGGNNLNVGLAFGLALLIGILVFGNVSGAHFNPAVTIGAWIAGRVSGIHVAPYILAQLLGGVTAGALLFMLAGGNPGLAAAVTQGGDTKDLMLSVSNGFGEHSPTAFAEYGIGGFSMATALIIEALGTALLVAAILGATSVRAPKALAPFGIALTLAVLVMFVIPFTNAALNPARATATAAFGHGWSLSQLWVFLVAPLVGAIIVGILFRIFSADEEFEVVEVVETIED